MKKLSLAFIAAGLCAALSSCDTFSLSDEDKAKLQTDAKAAYEAAKPQLETLAKDAAPIAASAAKEIIGK